MMKKDENPTRTGFFQITYKRRKVKKKKLNLGAGSYFHTTETKTGNDPVQMLLVKMLV